MAASKLSIANGALRLLSEGKLTQNELTNNSREPARLFNDLWADGGVRGALEAGQWKFAKRFVQVDYEPSYTAEIGAYQYIFDKPDDFVRTMGVWADGGETCPLDDYREEAGFWVANIPAIYVAYVSDDSSYGGDLSLWPESFKMFVEAHFASRMAGPLTSTGQEMLKVRKMFLRDALSTDGMADPTKRLPVGGWALSRGGNRFGGASENG